MTEVRESAHTSTALIHLSAHSHLESLFAVKTKHFDEFMLFDKSQLWRAAKVYVSAVAADAGSEE